MISTLSRLKREKLISQDQYAKLTVFIVEDLKNFYICEITTQVIRRAIALLEAHALKTLDAFQLACAVESQSQIFISADRQQIKVARKIGLKVETV